MLLTDRDIARLADSLDISEQEFVERYTVLAPNRRQLSLSEQADGSCLFLKENRCELYAARPQQCREFPHGWRDTSGCPALDKNQLKR